MVTPITSDVPTPKDVVSRARAMIPTLIERAPKQQAHRRILDETIADLKAAGFFKILQPKRWGGWELQPRTFFDVQAALAEGDVSVGWVFGILGVHSFHLALFDDKAAEDVWGKDNTALIASPYSPGKAVPAEGGYRLTGHWRFSSGTEHCDWIFLGGVVDHGDSHASFLDADFRTFLLPRSDYLIEDVWDTIGLRGTGSNDIIVDRAFVPEYRTLSFLDTGRCYGPGQQQNTAPLYRLPFAMVFSNSVSVPVVGMATGAYEAYVGWTRERVRASTGGRAAEDPFNQLRIAEAAAGLDGAVLAIERNITEGLELASAGEKLPMPLRVRARRDQVAATAAAIAAVDRLFESAGGRALRAGTPIQRFWRDAHAGRVHAINDPEKVRVMYGQFELGLKVQDAWL